MANAEIVSIGSELLLGQIVDTNAAVDSPEAYRVGGQPILQDRGGR